MPDFDLKKVEILSGHDQDSPNAPRWFVNHHCADGSEIVMDDKPSHAEAWASAVESASEGGRCFPIEDNSSFR